MATELTTVSTQVQAMTRARLDRLSLRTQLSGPELLRVALLDYLSREERRLGIRGQYEPSAEVAEVGSGPTAAETSAIGRPNQVADIVEGVLILGEDDDLDGRECGSDALGVGHGDDRVNLLDVISAGDMPLFERRLREARSRHPECKELSYVLLLRKDDKASVSDHNGAAPQAGRGFRMQWIRPRRDATPRECRPAESPNSKAP